MQDISNREDIVQLLDTFYKTVRTDAIIGYIFNDAIGNDWSHHMPIMYNFWESVLFQRPAYQGNPIKKHIDLHKHIPLKPEHFKRWLVLWTTTVNDLFQGNVADEAINRATLMANLIEMKVKMSELPGFVQ